MTNTDLTEKVGEAYCFFYYKGSAQDIVDQLPTCIEESHTPELSLKVQPIDELDTTGDSALAATVQKEKKFNSNYVIKAVLPKKGNRNAANQLGTNMCGIYRRLYDAGEPFYAYIAYKRGSKYVYRKD